MNKKILITGGTGLMGRPLTELLLANGYSLNLLTRKSDNPKQEGISYFQWDVYKGKIDPACIEGVETVLHLAGEGIADKRWTTARKQQIIESRTKSIALIYDLIAGKETTVKHIISASAIGYYSDRGDHLLTEENAPNTDFLAESCVAWEKAVDRGAQLGLRIVKLRTGIVLTK